MRPPPSRPVAPPARQRGVSLIEVMIGIVVGLIIALAITASVGFIGKQFRITGAGASAAESSLLGLASIERDVRMAGAALFSGSLAALCPGVNMYDTAKTPATTHDGTSLSDVYPAVRITDGGAGSDIIDVMVMPPPALPAQSVAVVKELPASASVLKVSNPGVQFAAGDILLVAHPPPNAAGNPCTRIQVTNITGNCTDANGCNVNFGAGGSDLNPSNPNHAFSSVQSYAPGAVLLRLPTFSYVRYSARCNSLLRHDAAITPSCTGAPSYRDSALSSDIVMLKAQYGIATADSDVIAQWKTAATTTAEERSRVKAVRIAIVARSRESDLSTVTPSAPVVFDGSVTLDLSGTSVPAGKTWQNYRYRVHETVAPVRNAAWNR